MARNPLVILALAGLLALPALAVEDLSQRRAVAAADLRLASEWIAFSYRIPARVPQELLLSGYSYADVLVAMALVGEGASLNRVLQLRARDRWPRVAVNLGIDPASLPEPARGVMNLGRDSPPPPPLHFLPDVRAGLADRLALPSFVPTIPSPAQIERFGLDSREVQNIRRVLADPEGAPREWLLARAGRGLVAADWLIAGVLAHLRPFPLEEILETRVGQVVAWPDVALILSVDPEVLTQGPLASVYPILTGTGPHTVLAGRVRRRFPEEIPLRYDLERLTTAEKAALRPLMSFTYGATDSEQALLAARRLEMAEEAIALSLARMADLDLEVVLERHDGGDSWGRLVRRYAIDLRGQEALAAAIEVREGRR